MPHATRRQFASALAASLAWGATRRAAAAPRQAGAIAPPSDAMLAALPAVMAVAGVPGAGMGIVRAGQPAWQRYLGVTDASRQTPVAADTMFPAASLGKPVFAWAALRLADRGALDLDRPLKAYVPDHAPADARGDRVTPRHVLSHSSGFRNWRNNAGQPLVPDFDPGSRFQYSGEGFYYLQRAVEKITSRAFEQFMQEEMWTPLGMASSTYGWRADADARLVTGHTRGVAARQPSREFAGRLLQHAASLGRPLAAFTHEDIVAAMAALRPAPQALPNFIIPNAAGSLITTVPDYLAFLSCLLSENAPVPLSAGLRRTMTTTATPINAALSWALGWGVERTGHAGRDYLWHWGDNGPFKNFVLVHIPSRSAMVVFTNGSNGLRVAEDILVAATGHEHAAFDWL
jgi:CubicO group peptidase (beta-lactamase class C family)